MKKATTVLQPNGRLVIPAAIRHQLALGPGQKLEVSVEQGRLVLTPQVARLRQAQALLAEHAAGDDSRWSEALLAQRRAEAERE
jgi:AbrB family looped-hinge helix DNA binding protein